MNYKFETLLKEAVDNNLGILSQSTLGQSIRYSLLSPGKRIRPRLLLSCAEMLGLTISDVIPAAVALEMFHCFTLIHDDLPCMDNDDFRRGLPTNHKKFGEAMALLAGDSLLALATEIFFESKIEPKQLIQGFKKFIQAAGPKGVVGGQAEESELGTFSTLENLQMMHFKKTGALFLAALMVPKEFAQIPDDSIQGQSLISFGKELGLAFQVADDLEDAQEIKPNHVLFYLSRKQATDLTLDRLKKTTHEIQRIWGSSCKNLIQFADEISQKIEKA